MDINRIMNVLCMSLTLSLLKAEFPWLEIKETTTGLSFECNSQKRAKKVMARLKQILPGKIEEGGDQ